MSLVPKKPKKKLASKRTYGATRNMRVRPSRPLSCIPYAVSPYSSCGEEVKALDTFLYAPLSKGSSVDVGTIGDAGNYQSCYGFKYYPTQPTQGAGNANRVGRSVTFTGFEFRGTVSVTTLTSPMIRMIIVWDNQPAAYRVNDLLVTTPAVGGETVYMTSPYNFDWRSRFEILSDQKYIMKPNVVGGGAASSSTACNCYLESCTPLNKTVNFSGIFGGGSVANPPPAGLNGNVCIILMMEGTTNTPVIQGVARYTFVG